MSSGSGTWGFAGILGVMASTPFWFGGFDTIPQAMGEVNSTARLKLVPFVMAAAILLALVFYCLVILTTAVSMPREQLLQENLPVAGAIQATLNSVFFGRLVLFAGLCGLITTWNAIFFAASRLLFALGRARLFPSCFGRIHPVWGSPSFAVLFVGVAGGLGVLLGRNAVIPIVNVTAINFTLVFFLVTIGVIRLRRSQPDRNRPFRAPGALPYLAVAASFLILCLAIREPLRLASTGFPTEWILLLAWALLGLLFWVVGRSERNQISEEGRRKLILE